ncbi:MAG: anhydro-N-acetylmuramic acid kinase [Planctomycetota bacterium]|nr:anhydro-N-acetylmuramic acid kinase [Planctomycetota bacterium]
MSGILAIGCMTGTSCDGIDVAAVRVDLHSLRATFLEHRHLALGELSSSLLRVRRQEPMSASTLAEIARRVALLHVDAIRPIIDSCGTPDLIALHGQTVVHAPPLSWQWCDPWPVAAAFHVPIVFDLRSADIAEGGQGAPLVPLADWVFFRSAQPTIVLNLGGFANATLLPSDDASSLKSIQGGDLCACCQWLDGLARALLSRPFDQNGEVAASGAVDELKAAKWSEQLNPTHRNSLGTSEEIRVAALVHEIATAHESPSNQLATATDALARTIASRLTIPVNARILAAGGGALHLLLMRRIAFHTGVSVESTAIAGVPIDAREAAAWALLGALAQQRTISLPSVTGRQSSHLADGVWVHPLRSFQSSSRNPHTT